MRTWPRLITVEARLLDDGRILVKGTGPLKAIGPVVLKLGAAPTCSHAAQSAMSFLCDVEDTIARAILS